MNIKRIAIDFDNTIVDSDFPQILRLKKYAKEVINNWFDEGKIIIINSCRATNHYEDMVSFLNNNGVNYHYANQNDPILINFYGKDCRKISADIYIDDKNLYSFNKIDWKDVKNKVKILDK